jgi:ATP-dependent helicase/nuclease subunit A
VRETAAEQPPVEATELTKGKKQLDLFGMAIEAPSPAREQKEDSDVPEILEGVIDLAFREKGGWVIADYKTDIGTDPDFGTRVDAYRRQVDLYAEAWTRLTGDPVKERVLFFTAQDKIESW